METNRIIHVQQKVSVKAEKWESGILTVDFHWVGKAIGAQYSEDVLKSQGKGDVNKGIEIVRDACSGATDEDARPGVARPLQGEISELRQENWRLISKIRGIILRKCPPSEERSPDATSSTNQIWWT